MTLTFWQRKSVPERRAKTPVTAGNAQRSHETRGIAFAKIDGESVACQFFGIPARDELAACLRSG
jgi:hypothetical protein